MMVSWKVRRSTIAAHRRRAVKGPARYRDRHAVARKKSDHLDALVLASILRTDAHAHRALPADTELVRTDPASPTPKA